MDRLKRFIVRFVTSKKTPALKKGCPFPLESLGALFLHSATYREQYFQYGGSLDGVIEIFKEMINLGWADKKPELLLEIPLGLFRCIQEKIRFYETSRYGKFCRFCQSALRKIGKRDPIERGLSFLADSEFKTLSPYLKKQILELTRQHVQAEEKKLKEAFSKKGESLEWKEESLEIVSSVVFRSVHGLLGNVDITMIDRVFFELSDKKEPRFEKWVILQVGLHLPSLLSEKQKTWEIQNAPPVVPQAAIVQTIDIQSVSIPVISIEESVKEALNASQVKVEGAGQEFAPCEQNPAGSKLEKVMTKPLESPGQGAC